MRAKQKPVLLSMSALCLRAGREIRLRWAWPATTADQNPQYVPQFWHSPAIRPTSRVAPIDRAHPLAGRAGSAAQSATGWPAKRRSTRCPRRCAPARLCRAQPRTGKASIQPDRIRSATTIRHRSMPAVRRARRARESCSRRGLSLGLVEYHAARDIDGWGYVGCDQSDTARCRVAMQNLIETRYIGLVKAVIGFVQEPD